MEDSALRVCGPLSNRATLQHCEWAVCEFCYSRYPPTRIQVWRDSDASGEGQTAVCPRCGVAAVVGYGRGDTPAGG